MKNSTETTIRNLRYNNAILEDMVMELMKTADACRRNVRSVDEVNWFDRDHWLKCVKSVYGYKYDEILESAD